MAQPRRFLVDTPLMGPGDYRLGEAESRHAVDALRLARGEAIALFDGRGHHAAAVIVGGDRNGIVARASAIATDAPPGLELTVAAAIPKGKRWQALVEKCTELGVDRILPLLAERSVARGGGGAGRWRRWAVETAKGLIIQQGFKAIRAAPALLVNSRIGA